MMVPFFVDVNPATVDIKRLCHLDIVAALIVVSHVNDRFTNFSFSENIDEMNDLRKKSNFSYICIVRLEQEKHIF